MRRTAVSTAAALAFALALGAADAAAQAAFKVPFKFQVAGRKLAAGDYTIAKAASGAFELKAVGKDVTVTVPVVEPMTAPSVPVEGAALVFDEVGDFAPSYTEYMTVYLLSEVWLSPQDGYLIKLTKGAHGHKVVPADAAK